MCAVRYDNAMISHDFQTSMNVRDQKTLVVKTLSAKTTQGDSTAHANQDLNQQPTNPWFVKVSPLIYLSSLWCSIFQTLNLLNCLIKFLQFNSVSLTLSLPCLQFIPINQQFVRWTSFTSHTRI